MPSLEFICPNCNKKDKITLMGESQGIFEKKKMQIAKQCLN